MELTSAELKYYSRQLNLQEFGAIAQNKLKESSVFVAGAGGLGCPALQYLAGAGVGNITISDGDVVNLENLHRQVIYGIGDIGKKKVDVAKEKLLNINPNIRITAIPYHLTSDNISELIQDIDLVIDATDNFETRFLLGDYTAQMNVPLIYASVYGFEGQLTVFNYRNGPAFRDLFPEIPPKNTFQDCIINGVIGFVPGIMGCLQASEAIKIITGVGAVASGKLLVFDLLTMNKTELKIKSAKKTIQAESINKKTDNSMIYDISISELEEKLNKVSILDVREIYEFNQYNIGGTLIPFSQIPQRISEIPTDKDIVVVCESGIRSLHAAKYLSSVFTGLNIYNLKGGLKVLRG